MVAELKFPKKKVQTSVQYHCQNCITDFCLIDRNIRCPNCESQDLSQMVIIYQEPDTDMDYMMTKDDWKAGD